MARNYEFGNMNASLFATEGISSVGPKLAPLSAFACGLIIALGNRLSSGLSPTLILLSGGMLSQAFLNVPLTTSLLTNGAALTFLLLYITPRSLFEGEPTRKADHDFRSTTGASEAPGRPAPKSLLSDSPGPSRFQALIAGLDLTLFRSFNRRSSCSP
jgi:hypothetical protein